MQLNRDTDYKKNTYTMYDNRKFLIFPVSELNKVDFSKVQETSAETVRRSVNQQKTFIKWDGDNPSFVSTLNNIEGPYTYEQILAILSTEEWTEEMPFV